MINYNYWCPNNLKCDSRGNVVIQKEKKDEGRLEYCENCGHELKLLGEIPSGGFLKFASSSPQQKRENLKKRSQKHFKSHIKENKEYMDKFYKP